MTVDFRDALIELHVDNGDYLRLTGSPQLLEFFNGDDRLFLTDSAAERIFFSDAVFKANQRGAWHDRHLVVSNASILMFTPNKYRKARRDVDIRKLYGMIVSTQSSEIVFKIRDERDLRIRLARRLECSKVVKTQFEKLHGTALMVVRSEKASLESLTTTRAHLSKPGPYPGADLFLGPPVFIDPVDGSYDKKEESQGKDASDTAATTPVNDRSSLMYSSETPVTPRGADGHDKASSSVTYEGWLAKKSTTHRSWRPRFYRMVPPNLTYFIIRTKGIITIDDGAVKRFPTSKDENTLEMYLFDPTKIELLKEFAKSAMQEETISFYRDVIAFQALPEASAQQFNKGQTIYEMYIRPNAKHEVFLWNELREDLHDNISLAQERQILPCTIFDDALRQVTSQLRSDTFPRFLAQLKKRSSIAALACDRLDECHNCFTKYSMTRRRHVCGQCSHIFCGHCVTKEATYTNMSGAQVVGRVCDMCAFFLSASTNTQFGFSYVSRTAKRPLYLSASSFVDMIRWVTAFDAAISAVQNGTEMPNERVEGWLFKRSPSSTAWRRRYFVLDMGTLWYFSMTFDGSISISRGVGAHQSSIIGKTLCKDDFGGLKTHSDFSYRFIVSNSDRVYNLAADTEAQMLQWINCLKNVAIASLDDGSAAATANASGADLGSGPNPVALAHGSFMQDAPVGMVTFVFTDIQGSTALWELHPQPMNLAMIYHDRILRELLVKHHGYEVKTEGDAFMVTFATVKSAIDWCIDVQNGLLYCQWPTEIINSHDASRKVLDDKRRIIFCGLRVRMGVNCGFPNCRRNPTTNRMDYFGTVVNRASRISDSAHGGQIIVDSTVYDIADSEAYPAIFTDLGTHTYKGVTEPVRIFQVSSPELCTRSFPPLRSGNRNLNNIVANPVQPKTPRAALHWQANNHASGTIPDSDDDTDTFSTEDAATAPSVGTPRLNPITIPSVDTSSTAIPLPRSIAVAASLPISIPAPANSVSMNPPSAISVDMNLSPAISVDMNPSPAISVDMNPAPAISVDMNPAPAISVDMNPSPAISVDMNPTPAVSVSMPISIPGISTIVSPKSVQTALPVPAPRTLPPHISVDRPRSNP